MRSDKISLRPNEFGQPDFNWRLIASRVDLLELTPRINQHQVQILETQVIESIPALLDWTKTQLGLTHEQPYSQFAILELIAFFFP